MAGSEVHIRGDYVRSFMTPITLLCRHSPSAGLHLVLGLVASGYWLKAIRRAYRLSRSRADTMCRFHLAHCILLMMVDASESPARYNVHDATLLAAKITEQMLNSSYILFACIAGMEATL